MNPTPCGFCPDGVTTTVDHIGRPVCERCRETFIDRAVAKAGEPSIVVGCERKACVACGYQREVPVTRLNGGPPEWEQQCDLCQVTLAASSHEKMARRLRRRAVAIRRARGGGH